MSEMNANMSNGSILAIEMLSTAVEQASHVPVILWCGKEIA
jgi:hypothetical protein